jgi:hypothetical protein
MASNERKLAVCEIDALLMVYFLSYSTIRKLPYLSATLRLKERTASDVKKVIATNCPGISWNRQRTLKS